MIKAYNILNADPESYSLGFGFIERTFTYFLVLHYQNKIVNKNKKLIPFINMIYLYSFVYLYFSEFAIFTQRLSMLVVPGYWIVLPAVYEQLKKKDNKYIFIFVLLMYSILKMMIQCDQPYYKYTNSVFNKQDYNTSYQILLKGVN